MKPFSRSGSLLAFAAALLFASAAHAEAIFPKLARKAFAR